MSICKIDLSMSNVNRNELYATIDTQALIALLDVHALDQLLDNNEELWWTGDAEKFLIDEMGYEVVASGNTYNGESDLSDIMQWSIMAPEGNKELYADGVLLVQVHRGGDARANYGKVRAYKWSEFTMFFLEGCVGWDMEDLEGNRIDNQLSRRFETGYTANPTYELNRHITKILELSDSYAIVQLDDDTQVKLYPNHPADYS